MTFQPLKLIIQRLNIDSSFNSEHARDLNILEQIEVNPDANQASLADQLGVAVGTINWHLKRLISKGYVKASRLERKKLRYIITPEGIALRAKLTVDYIQNSFNVYRLVRERMLNTISDLKYRGITTARLVGEGDVADVCRLTCIEQGFPLTEDLNAPRLEVHGLKIFIEHEERLKHG